MSEHVLSPKLIAAIEREYRLDPVSDVGRVAGGRMGTNYWLNAGAAKYFLRKYRPYGAARIREIHAAKQYFLEQGISVIPPIRTQDSTFFECEGDIYALFPFVQGTHVARTELTDIHFASLGSYLARLHRIGRNPAIVINEAEHGWEREKFNGKVARIRDHISSKSVHDAFDLEVLRKLALQEALLSKYQESYVARYPLHLTHNDYHEGNIFFNPDGSIDRIFDWEKVQMNTRAKEIARALELMIFNNGYAPEAFGHAEVFLKAYAAEYSISPEELADGLRKRLQNLLYSVWVEHEHYFNDNNRTDDLLARETTWLDYHSDHFDDYVSILTSYLPMTV